MTAIETRKPAILTGGLAPWRAGGSVANPLTHSSFIPGKSDSSNTITVALTIFEQQRFHVAYGADRRRLGSSRSTVSNPDQPQSEQPMSPSTSAIAARRRAFKELHVSGCFVIPNPWDVGSARYLQSLGFKALATTSSGFAWSTGHYDGGMSRDVVLEHLRELVAATDLPVNADFESGFATDPQGVAESVRLAVETGVAGLSIEDASGNAAHPIHEIDVALARLRAARAAIDKSGSDTMLVGRAENFLHGRPDLNDTIARLKAYADAGADCLYAPGIRTREQIAAVVAALAPKPVNLLIGSTSEFTLQEVAALGVRRISVGGALARSAWGGFMRAARTIAEHGRFDGFADAASGAELNALFRGDPGR
jgi:2-methylisocitrate lyase-like PEP mutase family enzyme